MWLLSPNSVFLSTLFYYLFKFILILSDYFGYIIPPADESIVSKNGLLVNLFCFLFAIFFFLYANKLASFAQFFHFFLKN